MIKAIPYLFTKPFSYRDQFISFKKVLYIFLFVNTLLMFPMVDTIFGQQGIAGAPGFVWNGTSSFLNLLSHPFAHTRSYIPWFFISTQLLALILGYFQILPKLSAFSVYFFTANLLSKGGLFFTGGEVLICILLFYMIFVSEDTKLSPLQNTINNTAFYAMLIQVCVLYFFSTFFKLYDENWLNGKALLFITDIPFYTTNWLHSVIHYFPNFSKVLTYSVLIYQAAFPLLVWSKRIKIPFLAFGTILHLGIAFGMGIFTFGIMMIITYLLFLDSKQINQLTQALIRKKRG